MKTLVLCRHAKSDWPAGVADIDRPLKDRGKKDAHHLGSLLQSQGFMPDIMLSSPAMRAKSTARIVADALGYGSELRIDQNLYFQGVSSALEIVGELPSSMHTAMLFSHNPTMEEAVRYLLRMDAAYAMPTGGMACIESLTDDWHNFRAMRCSLRWLLVPRLARKGA